jgi:hypothetical protein
MSALLGHLASVERRSYEMIRREDDGLGFRHLGRILHDSFLRGSEMMRLLNDSSKNPMLRIAE